MGVNFWAQPGPVLKGLGPPVRNLRCLYLNLYGNENEQPLAAVVGCCHTVSSGHVVLSP